MWTVPAGGCFREGVVVTGIERTVEVRVRGNDEGRKGSASIRHCTCSPILQTHFNGYYKHSRLKNKKKKPTPLTLILKLLMLTSGPQRSYREWKRESVQSAAIWEYVQHHAQKAIPLRLRDSETASVWGNVWPWLEA